MSNYRTCRNYENLEKKIYPGVPPLGIPEIQRVEIDESKVTEFRGFNYALSASQRGAARAECKREKKKWFDLQK